MCELTAFIKTNKKQKVMEEIVKIVVNENFVECFDAVGKVKKIKGKLKEINMNKNEVIIEE